MPLQTPTQPATTRPSGGDGSQSSTPNQPAQPPYAPTSSTKRDHRGDSIRIQVLTKSWAQTASQASGNNTVPTSGVANVHLQSAAASQAPASNVYNPSYGPRSTGSAATKRQRTATSHISTNSQRVNDPDVCVKSGRSKKFYRIGDIISTPYHTPNLNPDLDSGHRRLKKTCEGPVYSKRRMFIVLWIHEQDMFCLPLYSFDGKGLRSKAPFLREEYVCVKNWDATQFENQGPHSPVVVKANKPMDVNTTIHLSGGTKISCQEDTSLSGRVGVKGFYELMQLWQDLAKKAQSQPYIE